MEPVEMEKMMHEDAESSNSMDEALLAHFTVQVAKDPWEPRPVPIRKTKPTHRQICCKAMWCAEMPFFVNFPMAVFLLVMFIFLSIVTVFIALIWADVGNYKIANCPVWTWATWIVVSWVVLFVIWSILWLLRQFFIAQKYRFMKVTYFLWGFWGPLVAFLFFASEYGTLALLTTWGLSGGATEWLQRINGAFFALAGFILLWELLRNFFIIRIERDLLWKRLSLLLWRERYLEDAIEISGEYSQKKSVLGSFSDSRSRASSSMFNLNDDDKPDLEEFDIWTGSVFNDTGLNVSVPAVMLAASARAERQMQMTRLAVRLGHYIFKALDTKRKRVLNIDDFREAFGAHDADAALSLWDKNGDGKVDKKEMVDVLMTIFGDRDELRLTLTSHRAIGRILGSLLGVAIGFIGLIIILQIFNIDILALILPIATALLGLIFIFGSSVRLVWESFMAVFSLRPWLHGDLVQLQGTKFMEVSEINLLNTVGFSRDGVHQSIPNQKALSSWVRNYGRSSPGRIMVLLRIGGNVSQSKFDALSEKMHDWVREHASMYKKNTFSCWMEPFSFDEDGFDDIRATAIGFQVYCVNCPRGNLGKWRKRRTRFMFAMRKAIHDLDLNSGGAPAGLAVKLDMSKAPERDNIVPLAELHAREREDQLAQDKRDALAQRLGVDPDDIPEDELESSGEDAAIEDRPIDLGIASEDGQYMNL